jgi:hypothetical protein
MKKVLIMLAFAGLAFAANAQLVLGGQIGLGLAGSHDDNYTPGLSQHTSSFVISPKIGYQVNDNWQFGALLMFGYDNLRTWNGGGEDNYDKKANLQFGIAPYARYTFGSWNKWSLFVEGQFVFGMSPETHTHTFVNGNEVGNGTDNGDKATFLRFSVVPGMNCKLSDHFSMDLYINIAELAWNALYTDVVNTHDFTFGANFTDMTINQYLNLFSIGFNYHF